LDPTERKLDELLRRVERIEARLGIEIFSRHGPGTWSDDFVAPEVEEEPLPEATVQPAVVPDEEEHWLQIELIDDDGDPFAGERYRVELPDGEVIEGVLDSHGRARVDNIEDPGKAQVTFPDMEGEEKRIK